MTRAFLFAAALLFPACASLTPAIPTRPVATDADARACTEALTTSDDRAVDYAACLIARGYAATVTPMGFANRARSGLRLDPDPYLFVEVQAARGQSDMALVAEDLRACQAAVRARAGDVSQRTPGEKAARAMGVAALATGSSALSMASLYNEPLRLFYAACAEERGYAVREWGPEP